MTVARAILLILLIDGGLSAAGISGSVVENTSGRPLARTKVTLRARGGSRGAGGMTQYSGSGGEFSFPDLAGGVYFLRAERKGYATTRYGQIDFDAPGTPIVLDQDGYFSAQIRMKRFAAITGKITDENDVGLPGVRVYAYRRNQVWQSVAFARSDDRGVYRLSGLGPGRYLVRTAVSSIEAGIALLPTYFGATLSARQARQIEINLDQEVTGIDISPAPGVLGSLSGRVIGGDARQVLLWGGNGPRRAPLKDGQTFEFGRLEPGAYTLMVLPEATRGAQAAYQEFSLGSDDLQVTLELHDAPELTLDCQAAAGKKLDPAAVTAFFRRQGSGGSPAQVLCGTTSVWPPGIWEVGVAPPGGLYVAAILEGTNGDLVHEFRILPGQKRTITVLLARDPGSVRGRVNLEGEPVAGAPVYLNATGVDLRNRVGGIRQTRSDKNGEFRFLNLPPGRYELLSSYRIRDPEREGWLSGRGTIVEVEKAKQSVTDVPLATDF